mmetsp:Transcript_16907/g.50501  ORF Transcript_16907/g.50501 Transcript_16907/m.50501 type:complete len:111 (+) Transcript_16907:204-536(+)
MGKGGMDYPGQKLSEQIYIYLIPAIGSVAWVFGYFAQDFKITFAGWLVGLVLAMLICVPDWPIFNRHPTPWLKEIPAPEGKKGGAVEKAEKSEGSGESKTSKKKKDKSKK